MAKQKFFIVLKYAIGILAASFILEFLELSQASSSGSITTLLTYKFWGKLAGLFLFYLASAYLFVFFAHKTKPGIDED